MFGILRIARPAFLKGLPARSSVEIAQCRVGAVRYYEIFLRPGRDGEAEALLFEQMRPFMSPRPVAGGLRLSEIVYFSPENFIREMLLNTALRCACYLGGMVGVIEPSGDTSIAMRFERFCETVLIDAESGFEAISDCNMIISFSGLAGLGAPPAEKIARAVIFTNAPDFFAAGLTVDWAIPAIPSAVAVPAEVDPTDFIAACHTLSGMYGLAALPPKKLFSRGKVISYEDIERFGTAL